MRLWDQAWCKLLRREQIEILEFFRYVDDVRNFVFSLAEGWRWAEGRFQFRDEWEVADLSSEMTDQARTTLELSKAMSSLVGFLKFEGEESGQFANLRLPTLDTEIWWDGISIKYSFFEKPQCPNRVFSMVIPIKPSPSESIFGDRSKKLSY